MKKKMMKDPRSIFIAILAIILLAVLFMFLDTGETRSFEIEDKCGKFVNLLSHTIEDEATCKSRCRAQCQSEDMNFKKVDFEVPVQGCNKCTCYCK